MQPRAAASTAGGTGWAGLQRPRHGEGSCASAGCWIPSTALPAQDGAGAVAGLSSPQPPGSVPCLQTAALSPPHCSSGQITHGSSSRPHSRDRGRGSLPGTAFFWLPKHVQKVKIIFQYRAVVVIPGGSGKKPLLCG